MKIVDMSSLSSALELKVREAWLADLQKKLEVMTEDYDREHDDAIYDKWIGLDEDDWYEGYVPPRGPRS